MQHLGAPLRRGSARNEFAQITNIGENAARYRQHQVAGGLFPRRRHGGRDRQKAAEMHKVDTQSRMPEQDGAPMLRM